MGKRIAVACAIAVALVLAGFGLYRLLFTQEEHTAPPPPSDAGAGVGGLRRVKVVSVVGRVEKRRGEAPWTVVKTGDDMRQDEAIRTSNDGKATLDIGDIATVEVSARSEFTVRELSETASRVRLEEGRLAADVHGQSESTFKVEAKGSDAVAETKKGQFSVLTTGKGQVSVATKKGRVRLSAKNKTVEVTEGMQSVVLPEQPPGEAEPIPPSLFLKVAKPRTRVQREKETVVKGTTTPGAVVSINGVYAQADEEGQFEATVALSEGKNKITVEAQDASGQLKKAALPEITVDTRPPDVKTDVKWGQD
jgi:hypothetical protein